MVFHKRTQLIVFERQLWPQPPYGASPYWWGLGRLSFYKDRKEVWQQKIPEADFDFNPLNLTDMQVFRSKKWGWILTFRASHETAQKIWKTLFGDEAHEC